MHRKRRQDSGVGLRRLRDSVVPPQNPRLAGDDEVGCHLEGRDHALITKDNLRVNVNAEFYIKVKPDEEGILQAQAERERANQDVITVQALAAADREAGVKLIAAKQVIEQDKIKRQTDAEVAAFARVKQAEADSQAAEKQAQARLTLAEAERKAKELEAMGQQALAMVEVNVARAKVKVKQMEVEVERQALKEVQIAIAQAIGQALSHADFKVYGDPSTMGNMIANLSKGLGLGALADGVMLGAPDGAKQAISQIGDFAATVATAFAEKLGVSNGRVETPVPEPTDEQPS